MEKSSFSCGNAVAEPDSRNFPTSFRGVFRVTEQIPRVDSPRDLVLYNPEFLMRIRPGIELAALTDVGCERENNEDRYSYWEPASDEQFQQKGRLAIVADGMGGYEGGQEASRIAIEAVENAYPNSAVHTPTLVYQGVVAPAC